MVNTAWERIESVWGDDPLTMSAVAKALGISFQAARKIRDGGGVKVVHVLDFARARGINPVWVATGEGPKLAVEQASGGYGKTPLAPAEVVDYLAGLLLTLDQEQRDNIGKCLGNLASFPDSEMAKQALTKALLGGESQCETQDHSKKAA